MSKVDLTWDEKARKRLSDALDKLSGKKEKTNDNVSEEFDIGEVDLSKFEAHKEEQDAEVAEKLRFGPEEKVSEILKKVRGFMEKRTKKTTDEFKMEPVDLSDMKLDKRDYMDKKKIMKVSEDIEM